MFLEVNLKAASAAEQLALSPFPAVVASVTLVFSRFWCHLKIESWTEGATYLTEGYLSGLQIVQGLKPAFSLLWFLLLVFSTCLWVSLGNLLAGVLPGLVCGVQTLDNIPSTVIYLIEL